MNQQEENTPVLIYLGTSQTECRDVKEDMMANGTVATSDVEQDVHVNPFAIVQNHPGN